MEMQENKGEIENHYLRIERIKCSKDHRTLLIWKSQPISQENPQEANIMINCSNVLWSLVYLPLNFHVSFFIIKYIYCYIPG
jgi:hypothetical protein